MCRIIPWPLKEFGAGEGNLLTTPTHIKLVTGTYEEGRRCIRALQPYWSIRIGRVPACMCACVCVCAGEGWMIVIVYTVQYSETQGKSPLAIIHAYI